MVRILGSNDQVVAVRTAAVLGRSRTRAVEARDPPGLSGIRHHLDHLQDVVPPVAIVVNVVQSGTDAREWFVDPSLFLRIAVRTVGNLERTQVVLPATIIGHGGEAVEVRVLPPEGHLDDLVEAVQAERGRHLDQPPHRRFGVIEFDPDPQPGGDLAPRSVDHVLLVLVWRRVDPRPRDAIETALRRGLYAEGSTHGVVVTSRRPRVAGCQPRLDTVQTSRHD